ncbi:MAG TPA: hypothetical protein VNZ64_24200 [Candidatus Acidoferrum sp.]|jgi:hypothetical protein|nr:hypothetical protein [Candidatus Acidoferrum sp.]
MTKDKQLEYVGVDVDVTDLEKTIPISVSKLKEIGAPKGTVIEQQEPQKRRFQLSDPNHTGSR